MRAILPAFFLGFILATAWAELVPPPTCGLLCLKGAIAASPCGTNQTCICTDEKLTTTAEICVMSNCTVKEALSTKNYSMASCGMQPRDEGWQTLWQGMSLFIVSAVAFFLRMTARLVGQAGLHWDDYLMIVAIISGAAFAATSIPLYWHGLGQDIWALPFDDITQMLIAYYHGEWIYAVVIFFTKMSLLLFYLRVFPAKSFRIQVYCVIAVLTIYSILAVVVSINQCSPVRGAWEYWHGEEKFSCLNRNALGWSSAVINMALDISIMVIPLRPLSKLEISLKKKLQLILMFLVGTFVTIVSIIRLQSLIHFSSTSNATWDYRAMGYWSQIEIHVGNLCACMPAMYSLLKKMWPALASTARDSSYAIRSSRAKSSGLNSKAKEDHEQNFVRLQDMDYKGAASSERILDTRN